MIGIIPVGMNYRAQRYPVVTFTIMGLCTALFLTTWFLKLSGDAQSVWEWEFEHLWLIPNESHWWTFFTSMFVHSGFMHLIGNMIYLFLFGACVEDLIGRLRFTLFYLVCGLGSALAHILFSPAHFATVIPLGGASGAISGCIGGYLLLRASAHIEFKWFVLFFFRFWSGDFTLPAWLVISFWFLSDLAKMLVVNSFSKHDGGVAFGAHVGGTLIGIGWIAIEKLAGNKFLEPEAELEETPVRIARPATPAPRPQTEARVIPLRPAMVTAVVEAPNIHLSWDGAQSGPFTASHVQQMFAAGEIPAVAHYWREGMGDWRNADELRETPSAT